MLNFRMRVIYSMLVAAAVFVNAGHADERVRKPGLRSESVGDPVEFARTMLDAYKSKNIKLLLDRSVDGPATPRLLSRYAPGTSRYNSLFRDSAWRWKAVKNWNGKFGEVRFIRHAKVQFLKPDSSGNVGFVSMSMENNNWKFDAIVHMPMTALRWPMEKLNRENERRAAILAAATKALEAHKSRNVEQVLKLAGAEGPVALRYLSEEEKLKSKSELLFSQENMQGIEQWSGDFGEAFVEETARVEFGRIEESMHVVTIVRDGDSWRFDDIHSPDIEDFQRLNEK